MPIAQAVRLTIISHSGYANYFTAFNLQKQPSLKLPGSTGATPIRALTLAAADLRFCFYEKHCEEHGELPLPNGVKAFHFKSYPHTADYFDADVQKKAVIGCTTDVVLNGLRRMPGFSAFEQQDLREVLPALEPGYEYKLVRVDFLRQSLVHNEPPPPRAPHTHTKGHLIHIRGPLRRTCSPAVHGPYTKMSINNLRGLQCAFFMRTTMGTPCTC